MTTCLCRTKVCCHIYLNGNDYECKTKSIIYIYIYINTLGGGVRGKHYKTSYILNLSSFPLYGSTSVILITIPRLSQVRCL
jgi:hypothetical protein